MKYLRADHHLFAQPGKGINLMTDVDVGVRLLHKQKHLLDSKKTLITCLNSMTSLSFSNQNLLLL